MAKMALFFVVLWVFVYGSISVFRMFTGKEKWEFAKSASFAGFITVITLLIAAVVVNSD